MRWCPGAPHARHNTTSVYTGAELFSMLPVELSTDRTSLGEGQERLAVVVDTLFREGTKQEDNASKVERQVRKSAAALLLESRVGERFDGIVTGSSEKGTWVRIFSPPVEGRVVHGFEDLDVGDRVTVELIDTNVERGFIDFACHRARDG